MGSSASFASLSSSADTTSWAWSAGRTRDEVPCSQVLAPRADLLLPLPGRGNQRLTPPHHPLCLLPDYATAIRCVSEDETSMTVRLHYLSSGSARVAFVIRRQEFFIPVRDRPRSKPTKHHGCSV